MCALKKILNAETIQIAGVSHAKRKHLLRPMVTSATAAARLGDVLSTRQTRFTTFAKCQTAHRLNLETVMAHEVKNAKISIRCDTTGLMIPLRRVEVSLYKLYGWRRFTMLGYWRRLLARYFESREGQ